MRIMKKWPKCSKDFWQALKKTKNFGLIDYHIPKTAGLEGLLNLLLPQAESWQTLERFSFLLAKL